jgi:hypothetical protein
MQRGRDRQAEVATPTEQPPRKLSGKRTTQQEHLESGAAILYERPPKGILVERRQSRIAGRNSQVQGQMGHRRRFRS